MGLSNLSPPSHQQTIEVLAQQLSGDEGALQAISALADQVKLNERALQSLSRQIAGRVRIASQIEEGNQQVEMQFLTKAFAIFVAFQIQLYFYHQVAAAGSGAESVTGRC